MGFGILFIGYFIAYAGAITPLAPFTYVMGSAIIVYSLKELILQNKMFFVSLLVSALLTVVSIVCLAMTLFSLDDSVTYTVFQYIKVILPIVFNVCIMSAVMIIAKKTEANTVFPKAVVAIAVTVIYFVLLVLVGTPIKNNQNAIEHLSVATLVVQLVSIAFNLVVIFNCYMRICYEDDVDMEKKTGIRPLDFLNDKLNDAMKPKNDGKGKKK